MAISAAHSWQLGKYPGEFFHANSIPRSDRPFGTLITKVPSSRIRRPTKFHCQTSSPVALTFVLLPVLAAPVR